MANPVLEAIRRRVTRREVAPGPTPAWPRAGTSEEAVAALPAVWAALGVQTVTCRTLMEAAQRSAALLQERGVRVVLTDGRTIAFCPGLVDALEAGGMTVLSGKLPHEEGPRYLRLQRWAGAEAGITVVMAAFADTGTLWVAGGPGGSRCASLLPPLHLALVPRSRVYPCFAAWIAAARAERTLDRWIEESSAWIAITGPSRTSDIEKVLTIGVHGPKAVIALLIEEA